ncbi:hypothetical protein MHH93_03695 [Priestia sp. FSL H7-0729]
MKKYSNIIIVLLFLLIIGSTFILIHNSIREKEVAVNTNYYTGFVSTVQKLDDTLSQISEVGSNGEIEQMFDVYTSIILVNDRLTLIKENTKNFSDHLDLLINDLLIFRNEYGYLVKDQLKGNHADSEVRIKVAKQIKLFLKDLPMEYQNSREFFDKFNAAADHIKPLLHLNF